MLIIASSLWRDFGIFLGGALIAAVVTFFITKKLFEKQLKENPPINEKMIRAMYMQMGRKPTEAQIRQTMKSLGQ